MLRLIASIRALLLALLLAAPSAALAASYGDTDALNALFEKLKIAESPMEAEVLTEEIWQIWLHPTVPALAAQMDAAGSAMSSGDLKGAKTIFDAVVATYPDYAEGWNQRATLEYETDDLTESLADIDKVLALEPRHFGALSGRVLIELQQDRHDDALKDMIAALAIHPYLSERALFPELSKDRINL